ncbi:MAG: ABC transporter permease [Anaerolineae bacterium]|nr:ABC transporter permease [Anaerolineae bacterium]
MARYLIRRILQAIPVLFFISAIVYGLIAISPVDPLAIYEENPNITPEDVAMLEYRLGLRQPVFLNFRGSSGTVKAEKIDLYSKFNASDGIEPVKTGELSAGARVAIVDDGRVGNVRWVKVLDVERRVTGWTERDRLSIRVNPFDSRYFRWLFAVLQGDMGRSNVERRPALEMILERLPATLYLMSAALIGQLLIAMPVGILSAVKQYSPFDYIATAISYMGRSIPIFWFGLLLIIFFHATLDWPAWAGERLAGTPLFPGGSMFDIRLKRELGRTPWWDYLYHLVLPATMLSVYGAARYMRYLRASMLEVIHQDYVRTARAKGLPERMVLYVHALKNAAIPLVTLLALDMPSLFGGALFTETIFGWPGMGRLFFRSAQRVDYAVLMGIVMINATLIVAFNLIADMVYAILDPRIAYN